MKNDERERLQRERFVKKRRQLFETYLKFRETIIKHKREMLEREREEKRDKIKIIREKDKTEKLE